MSVQRRLVSKLLPTNAAGIRLLHGVVPHVLLKIRLTLETFPALVTPERLFNCRRFKVRGYKSVARHAAGGGFCHHTVDGLCVGDGVFYSLVRVSVQGQVFTLVVVLLRLSQSDGVGLLLQDKVPRILVAEEVCQFRFNEGRLWAVFLPGGTSVFLLVAENLLVLGDILR